MPKMCPSPSKHLIVEEWYQPGDKWTCVNCNTLLVKNEKGKIIPSLAKDKYGRKDNEVLARNIFRKALIEQSNYLKLVTKEGIAEYVNDDLPVAIHTFVAQVASSMEASSSKPKSKSFNDPAFSYDWLTTSITANANQWKTVEPGVADNPVQSAQEYYSMELDGDSASSQPPF